MARSKRKQSRAVRQRTLAKQRRAQEEKQRRTVARDDDDSMFIGPGPELLRMMQAMETPEERAARDLEQEQRHKRAEARQLRGGQDAEPPDGFKVVAFSTKEGERFTVQWKDADPRDLRSKFVYGSRALAVEIAWEIYEGRSEPAILAPPHSPEH